MDEIIYLEKYKMLFNYSLQFKDSVLNIPFINKEVKSIIIDWLKLNN